MAVDRIKHTKPASKRTFLDELEPIPYEITDEEIAAMDPRMRKILFGIDDSDDDVDVIEEEPEVTDEDLDAVAPAAIPEEEKTKKAAEAKKAEPDKEEPAIEEEPEPFDPLTLFDLPDAPGPHVTLIFPADESESAILKIAKTVHNFDTQEAEGTAWHCARFTNDHSEELKEITDLLADRETVALFNGKRVPYGRGLWLPLMYIFTAGKVDQ